jgi:hypothetical protein
MIPRRLVIKIDSASHRRFHLRVPLWLVWLVLTPLALSLTPLAALLCLMRRINPLRMSCAVLRLIGSASGTHVEIQQPHGSFLMRII